MKEVALSAVKDDLSRYLRQAAKEEIVITANQGRAPARGQRCIRPRQGTSHGGRGR